MVILIQIIAMIIIVVIVIMIILMMILMMMIINKPDIKRSNLTDKQLLKPFCKTCVKGQSDVVWK